MLRQNVHPHLCMAPRAPRSAGPVRRRAAFPLGPALAPLAVVGAPLAAVGAALAGLVFLILLPICGIASVAQAAASAAWELARRLARSPAPENPED